MAQPAAIKHLLGGGLKILLKLQFMSKWSTRGLPFMLYLLLLNTIRFIRFVCRYILFANIIFPKNLNLILLSHINAVSTEDTSGKN